MKIDNLKDYLSNQKESLNIFQQIVLKALKDEDFIKVTDNLDELSHIGNINNVLQNPGAYDLENSANIRQYNQTIESICNLYTSYLYEKKGKFISLAGAVEDIQQNLKDCETQIENIKAVSELVSGSIVLKGYAKKYRTRYTTYVRKAQDWLKYLQYSFIGFALTFILLLTSNLIKPSLISKYLNLSIDIQKFGYVSILIVKIIILITVFQLIRFCARNYYANMHLAEQSLHKSDVLTSLQGVYETISDEDKESRNELIRNGALIAFQAPESGFITTKEGAGSSEIGLISLMSNVLKR